MAEDNTFTETEDAADVLELADLVLGFAWHDEARHWHLASYSYPDTFSDQDLDRLETLSQEFAERLSSTGLTIPEEENA